MTAKWWAQNRKLTYQTPRIWRRRAPKHVAVCNVICTTGALEVGTDKFCYTLPLGNLRVLSGRLFPSLAPSLLLTGFTRNGVSDFTQQTSAVKQLCKQHLTLTHSANDHCSMLIMRTQVWRTATFSQLWSIHGPTNALLDPEDGGRQLIRNVCQYWPNDTKLFQTICSFMQTAVIISGVTGNKIWI